MSCCSRGGRLGLASLLLLLLHYHVGGSSPVVVGPSVVNEGEAVSLHCSINETGSGQYTIQWYKDGLQIISSNHFNINSLSSNLSISSADASVHAGVYTCSALHNQTQITNSSLSFQLMVYFFNGKLSICTVTENGAKVSAIPSLANSSISSYTVALGNEVALTCCTPSAVPPVINVTWIHVHDQGTIPSSIGGGADGRWSLLFSDIIYDDRGDYRCACEHVVAGRMESEKIELKTVDSSSTEETPIDVSVPRSTVCAKPATNVTISCIVTGTVARNGVSWKKGGENGIISSNKKYYVHPVYNSLTIYNVEESDDGNYRCRAQYNNNVDSATVQLNVSCIHSVTVPASSIEAGLGTTRTLTCSSSHDNALTTPTLSWLTPNGTRVQGSTLSLSDLRYADSGEYTCTASSPHSLSASSNVTLRILGPPHLRLTSLSVGGARLYRPLTLQCTVNVSVVGQELKWSRGDGRSLDFGSGHVVASPSHTSNHLTIRNFNSTDVGIYNCIYRSNSDLYNDVTSSATISLTTELYLKDDATEHTGNLNGSLIINWEFLGGNGNRLRSVALFKGGVALKSSDNVNFTFDVSAAYLRIKRLRVSDDGDYYLIASDGVNELNKTIKINVNIPGSFSGVPPSNVQYVEGDLVSLECRVDGKPRPNVTWVKDLIALRSSERIISNSNGSLKIINVTMTDAGHYLCYFEAFDGEKKTRTVTIRVMPREATPTPSDQGNTILGVDQNLFIFILLSAVGLIFIFFIFLLLCFAFCYVKCRRRVHHGNGQQKAVLETTSFERRPSLRGSMRKDNSGILQQNPSDLSSLWTFTTENSKSNSVPMTAVSSSVAVSPGPPVPSPIPPPPDGPTASLATELNLPHGISSYPRNRLMLSNDIMGEGEFGPVVKGIARHIKEEESETLVAIKVLMSREGEETLWPSLMDFANQMRLSSPYVAKILGLCADNEPYYVIYEYLDRGDLKNFLFASHPTPHSEPLLTQSDLLHFVTQIANGMTYLYSQQIIHGDLATRNCLVGSNFTVKIADLGIGHDLYEQDYYDNGSQLLPIRWMAPELLKESSMGPEFSLASDIWSFGVFCWEVFSYARQPYEDLSDEQVLRLVPSGHLLSSPEEGMPALLYSLLMDCWHYDPMHRPLFTEIAPAIRSIDVD